MPNKELNEEEDEKLRARERERRIAFERNQAEMKKQKDHVQHLRRENKELKAAIEQRNKGSTAPNEAFHVKEVDLLKTKLFTQRRVLDDLRHANTAKANEIQKMTEFVDDLRKEAQPVLTDPLSQKIRTLENRLDSALIKHNEAMAVRRTYEQILRRLREERVGFDNQLAAIEKTLKAKEHDFMELRNMAHDALHQKEIAMAELKQFEAAFELERTTKAAEIEKKKGDLSKKIDQLNRQQVMKKKQQEEPQAQRQEEPEERKKNVLQLTTESKAVEVQQQQEKDYEAYQRIKEVAQAKNCAEVREKYYAQQQTMTDLAKKKEEVTKLIEERQRQKNDKMRDIENDKHSGSGQLGSRRIVDEFESHLAEAKTKLKKVSAHYETISKTFAAVKAGVAHIAAKIEYEDKASAKEIPDAALVDEWAHIEGKIQFLVTETSGYQNSLEEILAKNEVKLPQYNQRVRTKVSADGDDDDGDQKLKSDGRGELADAEDDPHDRKALKDLSKGAMQREAARDKKDKSRLQ